MSEISNHSEGDLDMVGLQCLADIRAAVGDRGQMTQPELVECIKRLRADAARYRWLADCYRHTAHWGERWAIVIDGPAPKHGRGGVDAAVDAARGH